MPTPPPAVEYEAEVSTNIRGSASITLGRNAGYSGTGYVDMGGQGSYLRWTSIDGGDCGGTCTFKIRYANGGSSSRRCEVTLNGDNTVVATLQFPVTGNWTTYDYSTIVETQCTAGSNSIKVKASTSDGGPNLDVLEFSSPVCATTDTSTSN